MPRVKKLDKEHFDKMRERSPEKKIAEKTIAKFGERIVKSRKAYVEKFNRDYQQNRVRYYERDEDYLKFYAPVMNWASVKYEIEKEHLEIAFFFYNHPVFTRPQFSNLCKMFSKHHNTTFRLFLKQGYIVGRDLGTGKAEKSTHYRLSLEMISKIKNIYKMMQLEEVPRSFDYTQNSSKRSVLQTSLRNLQKEVEDISSGKSSPDRIIFRNEE